MYKIQPCCLVNKVIIKFFLPLFFQFFLTNTVIRHNLFPWLSHRWFYVQTSNTKKALIDVHKSQDKLKVFFQQFIHKFTTTSENQKLKKEIKKKCLKLMDDSLCVIFRNL